MEQTMVIKGRKESAAKKSLKYRRKPTEKP